MLPVLLGVILPVISKLLLAGTLVLLHLTQQRLRSVPAPLFRRREPVAGRTRFSEGALGFGACYTVCAAFYFFALLGQPVGTSLRLRPDDGSPAQQAGLAPGDQASSVGGSPVKTFDEFREAVARSPRQVSIEVEREGRIVSLRITKDADNRIGVMPEPGEPRGVLAALSEAVIAPAVALEGWLRVMLHPGEPVTMAGPVGLGIEATGGAYPFARVLALLMTFDLFFVVLTHIVVLAADTRSRARYRAEHTSGALS